MKDKVNREPSVTSQSVNENEKGRKLNCSKFSGIYLKPNTEEDPKPEGFDVVTV